MGHRTIAKPSCERYHDLTIRPGPAPDRHAGVGAAGSGQRIVPWIKDLYRQARSHGSGLVFGVVRASDEGDQYYNSVLALDERVSWYDKRHLVPFAEFFPVPRFVRSWLRLMSLPYSDFTRGASDQPPLPVGGLMLGATICYEDAYGSAMLGVLPQADALVNVTNDAWFAPFQRALPAFPDLADAGGGGAAISDPRRERRRFRCDRPARRSRRTRS